MTKRDLAKQQQYNSALAAVRANLADRRAAAAKCCGSISGAMDCPLCGGKNALLFVQASPTKRLLGACKTEGCWSFVD